MLAYRTDEDRQRESGDVVSWPQRDDPGTKTLLGSLLSGLAAKTRFYCHPKLGGFTATLRSMCRFIVARGYPRGWWTHEFALQLLRNGVPFGCLPRQLREDNCKNNRELQLAEDRLALASISNKRVRNAPRNGNCYRRLVGDRKGRGFSSSFLPIL